MLARQYKAGAKIKNNMSGNMDLSAWGSQGIILYTGFGAVLLFLTILALFVLLRKKKIEDVFLNIAKAYRLSFKTSNSNGLPEVTGVVEGSYLRVRVGTSKEFGISEEANFIIASLVFELPINANLEVRRAGDYNGWQTPLPNGSSNNLENFRPLLDVYGSPDDAHMVLSEQLQAKLISLFSGNGEWRFHISRRDGEIMWRGKRLKDEKRLYKVIDTMIRIEALFFPDV